MEGGHSNEAKAAQYRWHGVGSRLEGKEEDGLARPVGSEVGAMGDRMEAQRLWLRREMAFQVQQGGEQQAEE